VPPEDLEVTFYERLEDAQTETNAINPNNYRNNAAFTINNEQSLWIRIDDTRNNSCAAIEKDRLVLKLKRLPDVIRNITPLFECSYASNRAVFDLTNKESEILNSLTGNSGTILFRGYHYIDNEQIVPITDPTAFLNTTNPQTIYVNITDDNLCSFDMSFEINTDRPNIDDSTKKISICFNNLNTEFDLTSVENEILNGETNVRINYYDSDNNLIVNPERFVGFVPLNKNPNQSYNVNVEVIDMDNNCFSETLIILNAGFYPVLPIPAPIEECEQDNDNIDEFDLTMRESEFLNGLDPSDFVFEYFRNFDNAQNSVNPIINPKKYLFNENLGNNPFVKITSIYNNCPRILPLSLRVEQINPIGLKDEYKICLFSNEEMYGDVPTIQTNLSDGDYNFEWFLKELGPFTRDFKQNDNFYVPNKEGKIILKATHKVTGCRIIDSTNVIKVYIPENIGIEYLNDFFEATNSIQITVKGRGSYKYSIDSLNFQDSPIFRNLLPGIYTARVIDNSSCVSKDAITQNFLILDYPKFFTPNGDGINDTWTIRGIFSASTNSFTSASADEGFLPEIYIFDRFGRMIKEIKSIDDPILRLKDK